MSMRMQRGVTVMLILVFMGVFLVILGTLSSFALQQARYGRALYAREQALHVAESGLEYYRWFLSHNPNDLTNGTGNPGPYEYVVTDPEDATEIGTASITVTGNMQCGDVQSIDITSEGTSDANPTYKRTISARYMKPSIAAYSYILDSNVWAGADRIITGPYHSNGGIRMDGSNNSDVTSGASTWQCDSSFGCSPTQTKDGVFGAGAGVALWRYPAATISFSDIRASLDDLKDYAKNHGGLYFGVATTSGNTPSVNQRGYHLIFQSDGSVLVRRVSATVNVRGSPDGSTFYDEYNIINTQTAGTYYAIPASCGVLFFDDRVWIEGTVSGKVTVVAATPSDTSTAPSAYLLGNILYAHNDGSDGLTVIAEKDVLIPLNSPDNLELHGIFVAQSGIYGRNYYFYNGYSSNSVPYAYRNYVRQNTLETQGTIVSSGRTGTKWTSGGVFVSGYDGRIDTYDQLQATDPPPFTPSTSVDYRFVQWREE